LIEQDAASTHLSEVGHASWEIEKVHDKDAQECPHQRKDKGLV
jgi:hypothetical protein